MDAQWQQYYWNHYLLQQQHHQQLANPDTTVSPPTATHHTYNPTGTYGPLTHALRTHQAHHSHPYTTSPYTPPPQHTPPQQAPPSQPEFPPPPPPPLPTADPVTPPPSTYKHSPPPPPAARVPARHLLHRHLTSHPPLHPSKTLGTKPTTIGTPTPCTATNYTVQSNPHSGLEKQEWQGFRPLTSSHGNWRTMAPPNLPPALLATENTRASLPPKVLRSRFS